MNYSDYQLYQILESNGYITDNENLQILKEGIEDGSIVLEELKEGPAKKLEPKYIEQTITTKDGQKTIKIDSRNLPSKNSTINKKEKAESFNKAINKAVTHTSSSSVSTGRIDPNKLPSKNSNNINSSVNKAVTHTGGLSRFAQNIKTRLKRI